jgi:hypothetical protein
VVVDLLRSDTRILQNLNLLVVSHHLHSQIGAKGLLRCSHGCGLVKRLGLHIGAHFHYSSRRYMGLSGCSNIHNESKHLVGHHRVRSSLLSPSDTTLTDMCRFAVITDIMIFVLPIPIIAPLNLPRRQKIAVVGIFTVGFLYDCPSPAPYLVSVLTDS